LPLIALPLIATLSSLTFIAAIALQFIWSLSSLIVIVFHCSKASLTLIALPFIAAIVFIAKIEVAASKSPKQK
jgi:hypothetical protein